MPRHRLHVVTIPVLSAFLLAACSPSGDPPQPKTPAPQAQPATRVPTIELPSFASLVKNEGAAVVNISTTHTVKQGALPVPEDDPLAEFFRRFMPQAPANPQEYQARGVGSGFIISADGYVLTNAHVVAESDEITVKLTNKREYRAKLIGADPRTDVALLKIDANNLPAVPIGDPAKLEVGEWVAAIGAPFGFENSVTAGIVSAKGRSLPDESYVPFIQTDVAVNPGNSGGPLFNMRGEVIGINSQIYSGTGGFMGLSFAIPIDIAMDVVRQLQTTGKVTRGRMGVQAQELTVELATSFGLKDPNGALIANVEKGGPADKAGIVPGDVIQSFNGKLVESSADLARLVASTRPGTTVAVELWRKGASHKVQVAVAELAPERTAAQAEPKQMPANRAGLALSELTSQQLNNLKIDHGLLVRNASGPAQRAGIQPGDVVLAINDTPTSNIAAFEEHLARSKGGAVALLIKRGADTLYLPVKLGSG
ncbi:DegQ family serine endoprotease [Noviherbaspirillum cavernae]|uniref:Probable periplasmic serine endoprotease DegP-like n=1 Tax=Noviherbaspirillum cavernae TaxID=2320862 RepID=A0A418X3I1_9BURK|nr:DegQ family serine endoprotease [Noviherbaspirillum cavernae]RJG07030.1 DegQ family serine endoprotease [Noviherbaspirillum cavernae]